MSHEESVALYEEINPASHFLREALFVNDFFL